MQVRAIAPATSLSPWRFTLTHSMLGILGGTFDPIHFGHLRTGLEVREALCWMSCVSSPAVNRRIESSPMPAPSSGRQWCGWRCRGSCSFVAMSANCGAPDPRTPWIPDRAPCRDGETTIVPGDRRGCPGGNHRVARVATPHRAGSSGGDAPPRVGSCATGGCVHRAGRPPDRRSGNVGGTPGWLHLVSGGHALGDLCLGDTCSGAGRPLDRFPPARPGGQVYPRSSTLPSLN